MPGRSDGFSLGVAGDLARDFDLVYAYDRAGRLDAVTSPHGVFDYAYLVNSPLRASLGSTFPPSGVKVLATYAYEPHRDVLASLENKVAATTVSRFDYTVNSLGQRTQRAQSGSAFAAASTDVFGYNPKGEVSSATNATLPDRNQAFAYDDIGNRRSFTTTLGTTSYGANSLNQYTQIAAPFVPSQADPTYDLDGNQRTTGLGQAYVWDAENRLVSVEPVLPLAGDQKLLNTYDSQSRRVRRQVFTYAGGAWSLSRDEKFIYDGWNPVAVYDATLPLHASGALLRSYTWGLDLSGSLQGAGGVGGLLALRDAGAVYHYTYDANGNVSELVDSAGTVVAHYEYTPFGDTYLATGSYAAANDYRFSTKPLDATSGLYYYGYRYYNPSTGRWLSRDPIGERGGLNLYGMVGNNPIGLIDFLGQEIWDYEKTTTDWDSGNGDTNFTGPTVSCDGDGSYRIAFHVTVKLPRITTLAQIGYPDPALARSVAASDEQDHVDDIEHWMTGAGHALAQDAERCGCPCSEASIKKLQKALENSALDMKIASKKFWDLTYIGNNLPHHSHSPGDNLNGITDPPGIAAHRASIDRLYDKYKSTTCSNH